MSRFSLKRIDDVIDRTGTEQTIKYLSLPRLGRPPPPIEQYVRDGLWVGPDVDIVAGMRDPVARAVSVVAFLSNRLGYLRHPVTVRDGGTPEALRQLFFHVLRAAQEERHGGDTLVELLAHAVFDYRRWFDDELGTGFSLNVQSARFDRDAAALMLRGTHRLLVYRVEDLTDPEASRRLAVAASDMMGANLPPVPAENVTGETRFRKFYEAYRQGLRLSPDDLDWFYDHRVIRQFYTPAEIETFRARWSR